MRVAVLILACALSGCGSSGNSNSGSAGTGQLAPVPLLITTDANGCLIDQNADVVLNYNFGVSPEPQALEWNCADAGGQNPVGVEAFYVFSASNSCYVERSRRTKPANCASRATAPENPLVAATIQIRGAPFIVFLSGSSFEGIVDVTVTNTGNRTLFGPTVETFSSPLAFDDLISLGGAGPLGVGYILPGETVNLNGNPMVSSNVGHGENLSFQASLRLMITDSTVFPLTSAGSGQVQAP